ncbi:uncharacterized protein LOC129938914 isoform X2 [Eupeodes corollae]|nr:uncharacterized protein LOC129938914 isoform X2 [Eupeodes corollae]
MESSKNPNTKTSQFELMVQFMTSHSDLAKGYLKSPEARQKSKQLWLNLSANLNAEGPPQRDVVGWKKVWADFKVHTKAKLRKNRINISATGGGPPKYYSLNALEEKVIELLDLNQAVDGMQRSLCFGVAHETNSNSQLEDYTESVGASVVGIENADEECIFDTTVDFETSLNTQRAEKENIPRQRITPKKRQNALLENQISHQIEYQNNMFMAMREVNDNLKSIVKYKKRNYELNEKKYTLKKDKQKFAKEKFEFKKLCAIEKNKNLVLKLELKKEILKLKQQQTFNIEDC